MILVFGKILHWFGFWKFLYNKACLEFFVRNFYLSLFLKINRFNFFRIKFYKNFVSWENLKISKTLKNHKNTKICFVLFPLCSDLKVLVFTCLVRNACNSEWRVIFLTDFHECTLSACQVTFPNGAFSLDQRIHVTCPLRLTKRRLQ